MKKFAFILILIAYSKFSSAEIPIIKTEGIVSQDLVVRGINQVCSEKNIILNLKKDLSNEQEVLASLEKIKATFYIIIGDEAAEFATRNLQGKDLIYSMVLNPKYNFAKRNAFGIDVLINVQQSFEFLKMINKGINTVALIYGENENEALVSYASEVAPKNNISLLAKGLKSEQDIVPLMSEIIPKAQALILLPSRITIMPEVSTYIIQKSITSKIPVIGLAELYLQYGALLTLSINPLTVGSAIGQSECLVAKGEPISKLRILKPTYVSIAINLKVAELLKLNIPDKIKEQAIKIIQ